MQTHGRARTTLRALLLLTCILAFTTCSLFTPPERPQNVILFIGDGMGPEQARAASLVLTGAEDSLSFQKFPVQTDVTTRSATDSITDSAASTTAMATGRKVQNGAVSVELPGSGEDLTTIVELASEVGMATGLVTTAFLTHATPAVFGAHTASRSNYAEIAADYVSGSRPNVLFGGGENGSVVADYEAAGYTVATTTTELTDLTVTLPPYAAALIGNDHLPYVYDGRPAGTPSLEDLTMAAIDLLLASGNPFFLMVEAGRIDHAAHANDIARMIPEVIELHEVVAAVAARDDIRDETLIIVTADHETGGLSVLGYTAGDPLPAVSWSTDYHTGIPVPLYATGPGSLSMRTVADNT
jgi:alkaline phosphatase